MPQLDLTAENAWHVNKLVPVSDEAGLLQHPDHSAAIAADPQALPDPFHALLSAAWQIHWH